MAEHSRTPDEEAPITARLAPESAPQPATQPAAHSPAPPQAPSFDVDARPSSDGQRRRMQDELVIEAERHRRMVGAEHAPPRQRRVFLPVMLFLITCLSTFWAGASGFHPEILLNGRLSAIFKPIIDHWGSGLIYMACVLAILLAHEMGHFLMTLRYRIAASLPYFLPVPITPIGTMGAVISMDGLSANRRQMFDIGLAGPIAGLVLAVPIMWYGASQLDLNDYRPTAIDNEVGSHGYHLPLLVREMIDLSRPDGYEKISPTFEIPTSQLNPFFMAGWVGFLITGLNMLPISQLDGGHVIYALFGKRAHIIARLFLFFAIAFVVYNFDRAFIWMPMIVLVTLIGTDHPPTADDNAPLGVFRTVLGFASLAIPFLCFPPFGLRPLGL